MYTVGCHLSELQLSELVGQSSTGMRATHVYFSHAPHIQWRERESTWCLSIAKKLQIYEASEHGQSLSLLATKYGIGKVPTPNFSHTLHHCAP